ncbi:MULTISPECIES: hypothetical protein [unclassified Thermosynechococcus]|nr:MULTISPECIES: hypothetical protein [unclassified Thermosynechococcus]
MLPLTFHYWRHRDQQRLLEEVHQVWGITHVHPRSHRGAMWCIFK